MLAADEITITVGEDRIFLRPTLRAAYRLERRYSGFANLIQKIQDGSLSAIADVIQESSGHCSTTEFCRKLDAQPMQLSIEALSVPVFNHVLTLAGLDDCDEATGTKTSGSRLTFAAYHEKLFGIATGWLGWSPETAWNATAAEILAAYAGRQDMIRTVLSAIFGGDDDDPSSGAPIVHSDDEIAEGRARLKAMVASGGNIGV
jgi:hypothetical protein